jgi:diguanylate cyclase (GGDEF)-like protein
MPLFIALCLLLFPFTSGAQLGAAQSDGADSVSYDFERVTDELGSRQSSVYDIAEGPQGLIWFAGDTDGLLRFDGYHYLRWGDDAATDVGRFSVSAVLLSEDNELWLGTWGQGLLRWDTQTQRYVRLQTANSELLDDRVQELHQDDEGRIWVGTPAGMNILAHDENGVLRLQPFSAISASDPFDGLRIWSFSPANDELWVATSDGVIAIRNNLSSHRRFFMPPNSTSSGRDPEVRAIYANQQGVWTGTINGVYHKPAQSDQFVHVDPVAPESHQPTVNVIKSNTRGKLFIGARDGLYILDAETRELIYNAAGEARHLANVDVRDLHQDSNEGLWVASRDQGIFYSPSPRQTFKQLRAPQDEEIDQLLQQPVSALEYADNGDLWLTVPGYILRRTAKLSWRSWKIPDHLQSQRLGSMSIATNGDVWLGGTNELMVVRAETGELEILDEFYTRLGISNNGINSLYVDNDSLLVSVWGQGLARWRLSNNNLKWELRLQGENNLGVVTDIDVVADHTWLTTRYSGTFNRGAADTTWQQFNPRMLGERVMPSNNLSCLHPESRTRMWLCTDFGLVLLDATSLNSEVYRREQGLSHERIVDLMYDEAGYLWLATARGISRFDAATEQFINFAANDGLPALDISAGSLSRAPDGTMAAGTAAGAVEWQPDELPLAASEPSVALTRVWVDDEEITSSLNMASPQITLEPGHQSLSVQFSVLDFHYPVRNRAEYRLVGLHSDWRRLDSMRRVAFTTLPAGDYELQIRGWNSHGLRTGQTLELPIEVKAAWWQHPLVWGLGALAIAGLLVLIFRWRVAAMQRQNARLNALVEERTADLESLNQKLHTQSQTDYLTGLYNRRGFNERFAWLRSYAQRHPQPLSLVLLDIDHFKVFNDTYGHEAGDELLVSISQLLSDNLRKQDIVARWGGEEFVLLLPDTPTEGAQKLCEKLRTLIAGHELPHAEGSRQVTATLALFTSAVGDDDLDTMLHYADQALYAGKGSGRNKVVVAGN